MEEIGVIAKVEQPTEWCAGMVVVPKANSSSLYPIVPNGISALFYDKTYFWHARRMAIAQRPH